MRIVIASDHAGFKLKKVIAGGLESRGLDYTDVGTHSEERVDYVEYGEKAMKRLTSGEFDRAILVCGAGLGMTILANKFKGVRGTLCMDEYMAEMSRAHNDSNCLTLAGRIISSDLALRILSVWLDTAFEGGRHQLRLDKIRDLENKNFKLVNL
ncbi:MAG: ribose 5-phosphate isomerase B [Candidatus Aminicenantes bacterium]|nr:ribose 5-phosphate isomerase B [Candidatus Aminicenantes bacterium]